MYIQYLSSKWFFGSFAVREYLVEATATGFANLEERCNAIRILAERTRQFRFREVCPLVIQDERWRDTEVGRLHGLLEDLPSWSHVKATDVRLLVRLIEKPELSDYDRLQIKNL